MANKEEFISFCNQMIVDTDYTLEKEERERHAFLFPEKTKENLVEDARFWLESSTNILAKSLQRHIDEIDFTEVGPGLFMVLAKRIKSFDVQMLSYYCDVISGKEFSSRDFFKKFLPYAYDEPLRDPTGMFPIAMISDTLGSAKANLSQYFSYHEFDEDTVIEFIRDKVMAMRDVYVTVATSERDSDWNRRPELKRHDDILFFKRKPLWVQAEDPYAFISNFSTRYPDIRICSVSSRDMVDTGIPQDALCQEPREIPFKEPPLNYWLMYSSNEAREGILFVTGMGEGEYNIDSAQDMVMSLIEHGRVDDDFLPAKWVLVVVTDRGYNSFMELCHSFATYSYLESTMCNDSPINLTRFIDHMIVK